MQSGRHDIAEILLKVALKHQKSNPMQSVPITTNVESSNPAQARCTRAGRWCYPGTPVSSTNENDCHDITEILLKVALNAINLTSNPFISLLFIFLTLFMGSMILD